jgi:hypothetical protein
MKPWALVVVPLAFMPPSASRAQESCPSEKTFRLISTLNPVVGKTPLWVTTGSGALAWTGSNNPIQALWIRDLAAKGPAILGGKLKGGKATARFARVALGIPEERFKFDLLGEQPSTVKPADLQKYSFHRTFIWFPEPGCYEMTARVGPQQAVIYLNVAAAGTKDQKASR